jgi:hypothetical protein
VRLREQLWEPCTLISFGGKDNTVATKEVDEPPALDKKNLMTTVGVAIDRSLRLIPIKDDAGAEQARSMVGQLMTGIATLYREQQQEGGEAGDEGAGDAP